MSQMFPLPPPHFAKCHSTCMHTHPATQAAWGVHGRTYASARANKPAASGRQAGAKKGKKKKKAAYTYRCGRPTCAARKKTRGCTLIEFTQQPLLLSSPAAILRNERRRSDACSRAIMSSAAAQSANLPMVRL